MKEKSIKLTETDYLILNSMMTGTVVEVVLSLGEKDVKYYVVGKNDKIGDNKPKKEVTRKTEVKVPVTAIVNSVREEGLEIDKSYSAIPWDKITEVRGSYEKEKEITKYGNVSWLIIKAYKYLREGKVVAIHYSMVSDIFDKHSYGMLVGKIEELDNEGIHLNMAGEGKIKQGSSSLKYDDIVDIVDEEEFYG